LGQKTIDTDTYTAFRSTAGSDRLPPISITEAIGFNEGIRQRYRLTDLLVEFDLQWG